MLHLYSHGTSLCPSFSWSYLPATRAPVCSSVTHAFAIVALLLSRLRPSTMKIPLGDGIRRNWGERKNGAYPVTMTLWSPYWRRPGPETSTRGSDSLPAPWGNQPLLHPESSRMTPSKVSKADSVQRLPLASPFVRPTPWRSEYTDFYPHYATRMLSNLIPHRIRPWRCYMQISWRCSIVAVVAT